MAPIDSGRSRRDGKRRGAGRKSEPGESYRSAHRRKEKALADLREMDARKRKGELLEADAVRRKWADILRSVQAGVMAVVARFRSRFPEITAQQAAGLDEELRRALTALVDGTANESETADGPLH